MELEGFISFSPAIPCRSVARKTRFLESFQIFTKSFPHHFPVIEQRTLLLLLGMRAGQQDKREEKRRAGKEAAQSPLDLLYCLYIYL